MTTKESLQAVKKEVKTDWMFVLNYVEFYSIRFTTPTNYNDAYKAVRSQFGNEVYKIEPAVKYTAADVRKMNKERVFNPYNIFWGLVVIEEGKLTRSQATSLSKVSTGSVDYKRSYFFFHGAAHCFDERFQNVLNNMALTGVSGKMYKFTDKQFGMIRNNWKGIVPECPAPFTHPVVLKEGTEVSVVPLSNDQFNNAMSF
jgi:hypothetical protein